MSPLHPNSWQTPFVGVTYPLSKHYEVYGRFVKETNYNISAVYTANLGFARNFQLGGSHFEIYLLVNRFCAVSWFGRVWRWRPACDRRSAIRQRRDSRQLFARHSV
jgi:hypothetical protein